MSIADELREYVSTADRDVYTGKLLAIADRIDAAHEEALGSKVAMAISVGEDGTEFVSMPTKELSERYVELPKDADGVPIHLGDEVYQVEGGWVYTIESITLRSDNTTVTFSCKHGFGCDSAHNVRHYHAPTVEDVLREFALRVTGRECMTARPDVLAEYAAKLRLAGSDAE